jgi:hypothetical protein
MVKVNQKKISLLQALARVAERTSSPVAEYEKAHYADQFRLQKRVARFLTQGADQQMEHFPRRLPLWPPALLIERLEGTPMPWPKGAKSLIAFARKLDQKWRNIDAAVLKALQKLAKFGAEGSLSIFARRQLGPSVPLEQLDPHYFDIGGFDLAQAKRSRLAPTISHASTECFDGNGSYSIARTYFDVKLLATEIAKLFDLPDRLSCGLMIDKLRSWYVSVYVAGCVARGEKPSRTHAQEVAQQTFPEGLPPKLRELFRGFRRDYAPADWPARGRRKRN